MNVFDFAMKMEKDGLNFYHRLADEAAHPGLKTIFNRLADDEQKHYDTFRAMKERSQAARMEDSTVLEDARNLFEEMGGEEKKELGQVGGDLEGYRYAMKIEADSARLYEDAARREKDGEIKSLLLRIAEEEHRHFTVVENIYQFFNAPNQYLAWREFSNLDEFRNFGRDVDL